MGYNDGFTSWLQQEMDLRHFSRADLARKAGISTQAISSIFNNLRAPGSDVCNGIASAFRISPQFVHIKAGLLPPEKDKTALLEELEYKAAMLPPEKQQLIIDLINGIIFRGENNLRFEEKGRKQEK